LFSLIYAHNEFAKSNLYVLLSFWSVPVPRSASSPATFQPCSDFVASTLIGPWFVMKWKFWEFVIVHSVQAG